MMSNWINIKNRLPPEKTFHPVYITAIYSHFKEKYHVEAGRDAIVKVIMKK